MSKSNKQRHQFTVRTFNPFIAPFNCTGLIESETPAYDAVVVDDAVLATSVLSMKGFTQIDVRNMIASAKDFRTGVLTDPVANPEFSSMQMSFDIVRPMDQIGLKLARDQLTEAVMRWAEKSRVRGRRGYRLNAVKSLRSSTNSITSNGFDHVNTARIITYTTTVILHNATIYNNNQAIIGFDADWARDDLHNLWIHLERLNQVDIQTLLVRHSSLGQLIIDC